MKRLRDINLTIPKEAKALLEKDETFDFPLEEKILVEIYFVEATETDEIYKIRIPDFDDDFDILVDAQAMEVSRLIEEGGGGSVEEFIMEMAFIALERASEEQKTREFFEEISD